jgi:RimJ/RimL family protein N-acetyltransferase
MTERTFDKFLKFIKAKSKEDIESLEGFNTEAFTGHDEFKWTKENLTKSKKEGWDLYAAQFENDIVAVLLVKIENNQLLTKNTSIKLTHQGNGFSHQIKEFYETLAGKENVKKIVNYCFADNFRMISLNERHNYHFVGDESGVNGQPGITKWEKVIS